MDYCEECPLRLFNPKGHKIEGIGNPIYGNMIIVPYVDNKAYRFQSLHFEDMINQIAGLIHSSTGERIADYCYITPFIKCKQNIRCEIDDNIISRCFTLLKQEFIKYNPINILLLGSNISHYFLQDNINTNSYYLDIRNRKWFTNYHPSIVNHSPDKAQEFEQGLLKWFNAIKNNNFDNYEIQ